MRTFLDAVVEHRVEQNFAVFAIEGVVGVGLLALSASVVWRARNRRALLAAAVAMTLCSATWLIAANFGTARPLLSIVAGTILFVDAALGFVSHPQPSGQEHNKLERLLVSTVIGTAMWVVFGLALLGLATLESPLVLPLLYASMLVYAPSVGVGYLVMIVTAPFIADGVIHPLGPAVPLAWLQSVLMVYAFGWLKERRR